MRYDLPWQTRQHNIRQQQASDISFSIATLNEYLSSFVRKQRLDFDTDHIAGALISSWWSTYTYNCTLPSRFCLMHPKRHCSSALIGDDHIIDVHSHVSWSVHRANSPLMKSQGHSVAVHNDSTTTRRSFDTNPTKSIITVWKCQKNVLLSLSLSHS